MDAVYSNSCDSGHLQGSLFCFPKLLVKKSIYSSVLPYQTVTSRPGSAAALRPALYLTKIFSSSSIVYFSRRDKCAQSVDSTLREQEKVVSLGGKQLLRKK